MSHLCCGWFSMVFVWDFVARILQGYVGWQMTRWCCGQRFPCSSKCFIFVPVPWMGPRTPGTHWHSFKMCVYKVKRNKQINPAVLCPSTQEKAGPVLIVMHIFQPEGVGVVIIYQVLKISLTLKFLPDAVTIYLILISGSLHTLRILVKDRILSLERILKISKMSIGTCRPCLKADQVETGATFFPNQMCEMIRNLQRWPPLPRLPQIFHDIPTWILAIATRYKYTLSGAYHVCLQAPRTMHGDKDFSMIYFRKCHYFFLKVTPMYEHWWIWWTIAWGRDGMQHISFARPSLLATKTGTGRNIWNKKGIWRWQSHTFISSRSFWNVNFYFFEGSILGGLPNPNGKEISNLVGACLPTTNL